MPILRRSSEKTDIEVAIAKLLFEMDDHKADSEEYAKMTKQLVKLHAMKEAERPERVKPDTWAVIGGNAIIAVVVIAFEQHHVVTTKVSSFLTKLR